MELEKKTREIVKNEMEKGLAGFNAILLKYPSGFNGPSEVGIAAGSDVISDSLVRLQIGPHGSGNTGVMVAAFSAHYVAAVHLKVSPFWVKIAVAAAVFIAKNGVFDKECAIDETVPADFSLTPEVSTTLDDIARDSQWMAKALGVVSATKVNWFQTNHHTGQGRMQGYIRKFVSFIDPAIAEGDVESSLITLVWAIGHWASTGAVLAALGVKHVKTLISKVPFPKPADDMKLRLASLPAGVAKFGVVKAIFDRIAVSVVAEFLPPCPGVDDVYKIHDTILQHPLAFHIGRHFISRNPVKELPAVPEEVIEYAAAYIHAAHAGTTLARSPGLPVAAMVNTHIVFTITQGVMKSLRASSVNPEDVAKVISSTVGTNIAEQVKRLQETGRAAATIGGVAYTTSWADVVDDADAKLVSDKEMAGLLDAAAKTPGSPVIGPARE